MTNVKVALILKFVTLTSVFLFVSCAGMEPDTETDPMHQVSDIKEGPGLLSGEKGGFGVEAEAPWSKDKKKPDQADPQQTQAQAQRLQEQNEEFDRQIDELERQRRELEMLKEELKEILKTAPRTQ